MKGLIIAAGYGTRFLPVTKTIPKEMLPLVDRPAIDFIIEELIDSGIKDILIVSSRRKKSLEDYFDREIELESIFSKNSDSVNISKIAPAKANIYFVRQKEMLGTGHAILSCKEFVGDSPFVVAYPDDIVFSKIPLSKQLINIYEKTGNNVLGVEKKDTELSRYGVISYQNVDNYLKVKSIVEKPQKGSEPSNLISIGRYLFTSEILSLLENGFKNHKGGEFYHIDSINTLCRENKVYACQFEGSRIDVGDKVGYIEGIIKYALSREDLRETTFKIINKLIAEYNP